MKKITIIKFLISNLFALCMLGSSFMPVVASSAFAPRPLHTKIILEQPGAIALGEAFTLTGMMKDENNKPVSGKNIKFTIDDEYIGQTKTDENGSFTRKFKNSLIAGAHTVTASSTRTRFLEATTTSIEMRILPTEVMLQTVPPIAGVTFELNGKRFVSNEEGIARTTVNKIGMYRVHVLVEEYSNPLQRIEFGRWQEESFEPYRYIQVPGDNIIQVGINVYHLVNQSFVDMASAPIESQRVTEFMIRSAQGDVFILKHGNGTPENSVCYIGIPCWLPASRTARRVNGLEETKLLYSVINVIVDGSNVVNQSQQRFYTHPGENWEIALLFYTMSVDASDGLFGNRIGKSVNLTFPDGTAKNFPLDEDKVARIHALPRGNYTIEFVGTNGMSNRIPVALSRNQEVHTKVITYLDMAVVGLAGLALALGLLLYGRPWLLDYVRPKKRSTVQESA